MMWIVLILHASKAAQHNMALTICSWLSFLLKMNLVLGICSCQTDCMHIHKQKYSKVSTCVTVHLKHLKERLPFLSSKCLNDNIADTDKSQNVFIRGESIPFLSLLFLPRMKRGEYNSLVVMLEHTVS